MSDRPILFSAPMIRALLDGRKTQTRRARERLYPLPWTIADRLWVRENFALLPRSCYYLPKTIAPDPDMAAYYRADFDRSGKPPWKPSIHMPRWASRLTLTVTDVRVQRLQEISRDDILAEGITEREGQPIADVVAGWHEPYAGLWEKINGLGTWAQNPFVVALTFTVHRGNIDALAAPQDPSP